MGLAYLPTNLPTLNYLQMLQTKIYHTNVECLGYSLANPCYLFEWNPGRRQSLSFETIPVGCKQQKHSPRFKFPPTLHTTRGAQTPFGVGCWKSGDGDFCLSLVGTPLQGIVSQLKPKWHLHWYHELQVEGKHSCFEMTIRFHMPHNWWKSILIFYLFLFHLLIFWPVGMTPCNQCPSSHNRLLLQYFGLKDWEVERCETLELCTFRSNSTSQRLTKRRS